MQGNYQGIEEYIAICLSHLAKYYSICNILLRIYLFRKMYKAPNVLIGIANLTNIRSISDFSLGEGT